MVPIMDLRVRMMGKAFERRESETIHPGLGSGADEGVGVDVAVDGGRGRGRGCGRRRGRAEVEGWRSATGARSRLAPWWVEGRRSFTESTVARSPQPAARSP